MTITALDENRTELYRQTYYSIGGVVLLSMKPILAKRRKKHSPSALSLQNAEDILKHCSDNGLMLSTVMLENEIALNGKEAVSAHIENVWKTMQACIEHGIHTEGILPGPLKSTTSCGFTLSYVAS